MILMLEKCLLIFSNNIDGIEFLKINVSTQLHVLNPMMQSYSNCFDSKLNKKQE